MLYLIGLGLNERGISKEGLLAIEKCSKVYLENYTVDFPYKVEDLKLGKKKIEVLERKDVESNRLIKEAKGSKIGLLVYGSPLFATTHMSLILDAKKQKVRTRVIYAASILDAIAGTGLQLYKFGKISSMPEWKENFTPDSFLDFVKENQSIKAHSLILVDIGLRLDKALEQLEVASKNKDVVLDKIIVCSNMGTDDEKIIYKKISELKKQKVKSPFCFIIPSELHFLEKDALNKDI
jgi:diphthine synthase|tara:strand:+ start:380 stop:1090 length:711 start_codon:yes stop_codon:yes gene_type:complete